MRRGMAAWRGAPAGLVTLGAMMLVVCALPAPGEAAAILRADASTDHHRVHRHTLCIGPNFRDASMPGFNAAGGDFFAADFSGADLIGATLSTADFAHACFHEADLASASLIRADLTGADLTEANLTSADLAGANLTDADFTGAKLDGVKAADAILDGTIGLNIPQ